MMDFITKIEELINNVLIKIAEVLIKTFFKITPKKFIRIFTHFKETLAELKIFLKNLPKNLIQKSILIFKDVKSKLFTINYKEKVLILISRFKSFYQDHYVKQTNKIKFLLRIPFTLISGWLKGLTPTQSILLLSLTAASILATLSIISTGNRLVDISRTKRSPASVENKLEYDRPKYYKKEAKHILMASIRLPVYSGDVNNLKTVDIDFNATLSNRQTRNSLEKLEFQLRDHLILKLEPQIADFLLLEEGKEIIREKIHEEIDEFLKERKLNGYVTEVKITYILAN